MELKSLETLIPQYAENKALMDNYKKLCDKENAEIKSIMMDLVIPSYTVGEYTATCSVSTRETMNEEMMLEIAHMYGIPEIVKTKEYIDYDALEKAIYDDKIPKDVLLEMDKAKEVKEVVTLRLKKAKKGKK